MSRWAKVGRFGSLYLLVGEDGRGRTVDVEDGIATDPCDLACLLKFVPVDFEEVEPTPDELAAIDAVLAAAPS